MIKRTLKTLVALVIVISTMLLTVSAEYDADFYESLHQGVIPVTEDMTYEQLFSLLNVVDNSKNKILTKKLEYFLQVIPAYYYKGFDSDKLFHEFISSIDKIDINNMDETYNALFALLDKFSFYANEERTQQMFSPTASRGIGISMIWGEESDGYDSKGIFVEMVAKGSPAESAGILPGDKILSFNGYDVSGVGFNAMSAIILTVEEDAQTLDITLEREGEIKSYTLLRTVSYFPEYTIKLYPENNLIYLDINSFMYDETVTEVSAELDKAWGAGYRKIIVDLRNNSGGDLSVAGSIMSKFTGNDRQALFSMGREGIKNYSVYHSIGNGYDFEEIGIMVNKGTASASEIFANTLRLVSGARIYGTTTYGKGVAQKVTTFIDKTTSGITSFVAYDIEGNTYNEKGIIPDEKVEDEFEKYHLPENLPTFTYQNYKNAVEGSTNKWVKGLEMRLEILDFLNPAKSDSTFDKDTTSAIIAFQIAFGLDVTGALNDETYFTIMSEIEMMEKSAYLQTFSVLDYVMRIYR